MSKGIKMPNGAGSVYKLSGKRRRPFAVMITAGWTNKGKQIRKIVGYAEDRMEGYRILSEYLGNPYDLDKKNITFNDIYNKLDPTMKEDALNDKMSMSNYKNLVNAYNNHLFQIHKKKIMETKKMELQSIFDYSTACHTTKGYMKNILSRIYSYCIDVIELPIPKNFAIELKIGNKIKSTKHFPFTLEEIKIIENDNEFIARLLTVSLYTGLRPKELVEIKNENVFLEDGYMIGGCKTNAGRNRIIPIHDNIYKIIKSLYSPTRTYLVISPVTNRNMSADYYSKCVTKYLKEKGLVHTAYDTRHTFATRCDECGISQTNIKVLMGHSLANDITSNVYIHKSAKILLEEIKKLNYDA